MQQLQWPGLERELVITQGSVGYVVVAAGIFQQLQVCTSDQFFPHGTVPARV